MRGLAIISILAGVVFGFALLIHPAYYFQVADFILSPRGVLIYAGIQVAWGSILIGAARFSQSPLLLGWIGVASILAGIAFPFIDTTLFATLIQNVAEMGFGILRVMIGLSIIVWLVILYSFLAQKEEKQDSPL